MGKSTGACMLVIGGRHTSKSDFFSAKTLVFNTFCSNLSSAVLNSTRKQSKPAGNFQKMTLQIGFSYYFEKKRRYQQILQKTFYGEMGFPYKRFFENGTSIIGNASDSMMNSVTWVWNGKDGKEIKRKKVKPNKGGGFVTPDH